MSVETASIDTVSDCGSEDFVSAGASGFVGAVDSEASELGVVGDSGASELRDAGGSIEIGEITGVSD